MISSKHLSQEITYITPLLAAGASGILTNGWPGATTTPMETGDATKVTFFFTADQNTRIDIYCMYDPSSVSYVWASIVALAGVLTTPYNLPAPMNGTGYLTPPGKWLYVILTDVSGINHTNTRFYLRAWS